VERAVAFAHRGRREVASTVRRAQQVEQLEAVLDDALQLLPVAGELRHLLPERLVAVLVLLVRATRTEVHALALEGHVGFEAVLRLAVRLERHGAEQAAVDARAGDDRARLLHEPLRARRRQLLQLAPRRLFVVRTVAAALAEVGLEAASALAVRVGEVDVDRNLRLLAVLEVALDAVAVAFEADRLTLGVGDRPHHDGDLAVFLAGVVEVELADEAVILRDEPRLHDLESVAVVEAQHRLAVRLLDLLERERAGATLLDEGQHEELRQRRAGDQHLVRKAQAVHEAGKPRGVEAVATTSEIDLFVLIHAAMRPVVRMGRDPTERPFFAGPEDPSRATRCKMSNPRDLRLLIPNSAERLKSGRTVKCTRDGTHLDARPRAVKPFHSTAPWGGAPGEGRQVSRQYL